MLYSESKYIIKNKNKNNKLSSSINVISALMCQFLYCSLLASGRLINCCDIFTYNHVQNPPYTTQSPSPTYRCSHLVYCIWLKYTLGQNALSPLTRVGIAMIGLSLSFSRICNPHPFLSIFWEKKSSEDQKKYTIIVLYVSVYFMKFIKISLT